MNARQLDAGRAMRDKFNRVIKPNKDRKPEAEAVAPQAETFSSPSSPFIRASVQTWHRDAWRRIGDVCDQCDGAGSASHH
jgi:hypothetical protein